MPSVARRLVGRLAEAVDRRRASARPGRSGSGGAPARRRPAGPRPRTGARRRAGTSHSRDQLVGRRRPAGELPAGQLQGEVAQRLAGLGEQRLDPLEGQELGGISAPGSTGRSVSARAMSGWWRRMYLTANCAERRVGRAGGDRPSPRAARSRPGWRRPRRACGSPASILQERRLGDDLDVRPGGVQLLGLDLLVALLAAAVERRALVADDQVMQLAASRAEATTPFGLRHLVLGLLARHRRHLAGEQERGAARGRPRPAPAGRGRRGGCLPAGRSRRGRTP